MAGSPPDATCLPIYLLRANIQKQPRHNGLHSFTRSEADGEVQKTRVQTIKKQKENKRKSK
jgi:hypothetical protein